MLTVLTSIIGVISQRRLILTKLIQFSIKLFSFTEIRQRSIDFHRTHSIHWKKPEKPFLDQEEKISSSWISLLRLFWIFPKMPHWIFIFTFSSLLFLWFFPQIFWQFSIYHLIILFNTSELYPNIKSEVHFWYSHTKNLNSLSFHK